MGSISGAQVAPVVVLLLFNIYKTNIAGRTGAETKWICGLRPTLGRCKWSDSFAGRVQVVFVN